MNPDPIKLIVLDAQGVTFNAPFLLYLKFLADQIGTPQVELIVRWHQEFRDMAWLGKIGDRHLWDQLLERKVNVDEILAGLEQNFVRGKAAEHLRNWSETIPIWMLSNHRTHWLIPRLKRFGIDVYFERVLVSDQIGFMKPHPEAFRQALSSNIPKHQILIVDDQKRNTDVAESLGFQTILADDRSNWVAEIYKKLAQGR